MDVGADNIRLFHRKIVQCMSLLMAQMRSAATSDLSPLLGAERT